MSNIIPFLSALSLFAVPTNNNAVPTNKNNLINNMWS